MPRQASNAGRDALLLVIWSRACPEIATDAAALGRDLVRDRMGANYISLTATGSQSEVQDDLLCSTFYPCLAMWLMCGIAASPISPESAAQPDRVD